MALLDRLVDAVRDPLVADKGQRPIERALPKLVKRAWKRLKRAGEAIGPDDSDDEYHAVRIKAKRLRYAAEAIGPWLGDRGSRLERVAVAAAGLQDLLGAMHDAVVSRSDLEASLGEAHDSEYAYMAGRLVERLCASASERRRRYPKAWRRVARRWRKA